MKKSIKTRLLGSHLIAILVAVLILIAISFFCIRNYYYKSIEDNLRKQVQNSIKFYLKYYSNEDITIYVDDLIESLHNSTNAEVQVINEDKKIIRDSLGLKKDTEMKYPDIQYVLENNKEYTWIGVLNYSNEKCISISYPLKDGENNSLNVVRIVASLKQTDSFLRNILFIFMAVGSFVVVVIAGVSSFISNSIINPLKVVTKTAERMAEGRFSERAVKIYDDEIGILSDTLNLMADEILKNEKLKNDFISSVSHELRTPLTSIKGWALTMKRKDFKDEVRREEALDIIVDESERLTNLVEELLDFSRFQANGMLMNFEIINLSKLLNNILNQLEPRLERNSIIIDKEISEEYFIEGDKHRLKQVFINILDNSLKFTKSGGEIYVHTKRSNDNVIINIEDTGIGIKKEHLKHVFKKFYKANPSSAGNGIGLSMCDEIIKLHNGKLEITSEESMGTKVTVILKIKS